MVRETLLCFALAASFISAGAANANDLEQTASASLKNTNRISVGDVALRQMPHGVLLEARLNDLPPGIHAFHIHEVGECIPPFDSAGGHYAPAGASHGFMSEDGPHVGDMPNIHVPESGELRIEIWHSRLALNETLFDDDGASIVIHEGPDDYATDPAGNAGPRIACGVIEE